MIGYSLRLLRSTLRSLARPRMGYFDESVIPMRVWPADLDTWGHMNNGRYLTIMDLGRTDMAARSGLAAAWLRHGWMPILGGATIRYRRPLQPLRRYELRTRMVGWDDKWFYFEQRFTRRGQTCAVALVKGVVRRHAEIIPPSEMAVACGIPAESPPIPAAVLRWNETEEALLAS